MYRCLYVFFHATAMELLIPDNHGFKGLLIVVPSPHAGSAFPLPRALVLAASCNRVAQNSTYGPNSCMCFQHVVKTSIFPARGGDSVVNARTLQNWLVLHRYIYFRESNHSQALNESRLEKGKLHTVLYWQEQSTNFRGRCQCQYNSYVKNSKLCNNLIYKEFIAAQKLTFISSSASWCAVWVKQQHGCSVSAPTV